MSYTLSAILSFSVIFSMIIGWIRFAKIGSTFVPFLLLITIAAANELVSFIAIKTHHSNAVNSNIYSLFEGLLIVWQFERWKLFKHRRIFYLLLMIIPACWCTEVFVISTIKDFSSYFIITSSFITVMLSISMMNQILINQLSPLQMNPVFLICICFIALYTYNALLEIFWIYGLGSSSSFRLYIYRIFYFINLLTNLTYAFALLWIPKKREFIVLS